jgi:hypothetical protein
MITHQQPKMENKAKKKRISDDGNYLQVAGIQVAPFLHHLKQ